MKLCWN